MAQSTSGPLCYDAVIATRNRPEALELSVPLLLDQSCPPRRLIVIDSSDDHAPVAECMARLTAGWDGDVIVEPSHPGLPLQRNRGLAHVTAPIVLLPDDDSLLCAGAAEAMLEVYARDTECAIPAVGAAEAMTPPEGVLPEGSYGMDASHLREAKIRGFRNRLESGLSALKPSLYLGQALNARHDLPDWLADLDVVPVEYITGFRMSFRTEAIREVGFDETLGGYALDEDVDASFTAMRKGIVVGARRARIYHHRFPSGRGNGRQRGSMEVLNRLYVGLKHVLQPGIPDDLLRGVRWRLRGFLALKLMSSLPGLRSEFGRARLQGVLGAIRASGPMWQATPATLPEAYAAAFDKATGP